MRGRSTTLITLSLAAVLLSPACPALAVTTGGSSPWLYVAMGDSYSSGEGLDPADASGKGYYSESNSSTNQCHRSNLSYAPLIAGSMETNGVLPKGQWAFTACSGDTTSTMVTGSGKDFSKPTKTPQMSYLSESTKFISLTIGGNEGLLHE